MLKGEFVAYLLFWCGWDGRENESLYNYVAERCEGKVRMTKLHTVMVAKNKNVRTDNQEVKRRQQQFNAEMDAFVDSILNAEAGKGL